MGGWNVGADTCSGGTFFSPVKARKAKAGPSTAVVAATFAQDDIQIFGAQDDKSGGGE